MALVVGLAGLASYWPQCRYEFVYDDVRLIVQNPTVTGGPWLDCLSQPFWPRAFSLDPLYRPVTTLSLRLNHALSGDQPFGYRVTNALLHGICSALVALLAARFWRNAWSGWGAGMLFAVHPLHAEAVALVVGRAELLSAVFSIGLLYVHLGFLSGSRRPSVKHHLLCASLLLLAIGSKEHAVMMLPGMVFLDAWARRKNRPSQPVRERVNRLAASHYLGMALVVAALFFARWLLFGGRTTLPSDFVDPFANPLVDASWPVKMATAAALLFLAVRLFLLPVDLCPIWSVGGFDLPEGFARTDVWLGVLLAAGIVAAAVLAIRRQSRIGPVPALAGLFLLLPCHFIPAANWLFAERWLYLPSAFLILTLAGLARGRTAMAAFAAAGVVPVGPTADDR